MNFIARISVPKKSKPKTRSTRKIKSQVTEFTNASFIGNHARRGSLSIYAFRIGYTPNMKRYSSHITLPGKTSHAARDVASQMSHTWGEPISIYITTMRSEASIQTERSSASTSAPSAIIATPSATVIADIASFFVSFIAYTQGIISPPRHSQRQSRHIRFAQQLQTSSSVVVRR